ncbi:MAG: AAA family ATPase [Gemmatimonadota bacterium]|nr:AAA family ATPase [Gemmatimonadota bacterium]
MDVRKLIIEDVRCFAGRQEFEIRPLTYLVGENSTGKSTALGCFQTIYEFIYGRRTGLDFNVKPYQMGAFSEIVKRSNPKLTKFLLGLEVGAEDHEENLEYTLELSAKDTGSEPVVRKQKITSQLGDVEFVESNQDIDEHGQSETGLLNLLTRSQFEVVGFEKESTKSRFTVSLSRQAMETTVLSILRTAKSRMARDSVISNLYENTGSTKPEERAFEEFADVLSRFLGGDTSISLTEYLANPFKSTSDVPHEIYSFAPLRSEPQRTYNPLREEVSPAGSDIPMVLMNISKAKGIHWEKLKERLIKFGKSSGLFTDIQVRRLGKSMGDPFQIQIKVKGPRANLIDVGYGINQILPILVRIFNSRSKVFYLMQQPEIHLHPKGQAELASLMIETINHEKNRYIIETHSDAMINRARIEIMNGNIEPQDVSLIYLEPAGNQVLVHNIHFDKQANLIGAPPSYRDFFMNESDRLLGFSN